VLLSDGVPNTTQGLANLLVGIRNVGYAVTSLGLGNDYDTQLMTKIAADTGGNFHYLAQPEQIAAVFDDELSKLTTVVAHDVQLTLSAGPGVTLEPLVGFRGSAQTLTTAGGDLPATATPDRRLPA